MLQWRKNGILFRPAGRLPWMHEFAQVPTTLLLADRLRVYFSCRPRRADDGSCLSYSAFVDLDRSDLQTVLGVSPEPILELGSTGCFDQFGVMAGSVLAVGDEYWLYYCGWSRRVAVPYDWAIGLAISRDGGRSFVRRGRGPIVGASLDEPYLQACPIVQRFADHDWHMWYLSGTRWLHDAEQPESVYVIMHATSADGVTWSRDAQPVIPARVDSECQTSASVFSWQGSHRMLFSYRHGLHFRNSERGYRIGHAVSNDLRHWQRNDEQAGIAPSATGWDSQMICYPHVFELDGRTLLLYCGNEFGREGFGWAELLA